MKLWPLKPREGREGLTIRCSRCPNTLSRQGALVFGPPNIIGQTYKFHICGDCWQELRDWIDAL